QEGDKRRHDRNNQRYVCLYHSSSSLSTGVSAAQQLAKAMTSASQDCRLTHAMESRRMKERAAPAVSQTSMQANQNLRLSLALKGSSALPPSLRASCSAGRRSSSASSSQRSC